MIERLIACGVLVAFIATAISSCSDDTTSPDVPHSVAGVITDSLTGLAIDSAEVTFSDTSLPGPWYSDSLGRYRATTLGTSRTIYVQKTGYVTAWRALHLDKDMNGVDFRLLPQ